MKRRRNGAGALSTLESFTERPHFKTAEVSIVLCISPLSSNPNVMALLCSLFCRVLDFTNLRQLFFSLLQYKRRGGFTLDSNASCHPFAQRRDATSVNQSEGSNFLIWKKAQF